jgi:hypothetical protein
MDLRDDATAADVEEGLKLYFEKYNHDRTSRWTT